MVSRAGKYLQNPPKNTDAMECFYSRFFGRRTSYFLARKGLSSVKCFRTAFLYKTLWWLTASVFFHVLCKLHNSEIEILLVCFLSVYLTWDLHFKVSRLSCLVLQVYIEFLTIFDLIVLCLVSSSYFLFAARKWRALVSEVQSIWKFRHRHRDWDRHRHRHSNGNIAFCTNWKSNVNVVLVKLRAAHCREACLLKRWRIIDLSLYSS